MRRLAKESLKKLAAKYHLEDYDEKMQKAILLQLKRRARRRRLITVLCTILAVGSLGYFVGYYYLADKSDSQFAELAELKDKEPIVPFRIHKTGEKETPDILEEYINLYNKTKV